ncbi:MAG: RagB/SusD family nutrient uptake outer membrane protein [Sphingobacteriales bacterium]|nr:RagB/SusD family nutrient uptake outer membrane protein [Sphingobacteriales bacterium]
MKRILLIKSVSFIVGVSLLASCAKLDEHSKSNIEASDFYKTQPDAIAAINATYSALSTDINADFPIYGRNLNLIIDNTGDDQVYSPSNTNPDVRALGTAEYISSNDRVKKIYAQHYWGISRANLAIDKIPQIPANQFYDASHTASNLVREARFVRALLYFNLVRIFGDVPLVIHDAKNVQEASIKVDRAPRDSVYKQIIEDLDSAANISVGYGTAASDQGRATRGAAHALLAKVYIRRQDWVNAKIELEKTLTTGTFPAATGTYGYDLFPQFSKIFQTASKNGIEHIFSAQFKFNGGAANSTQNLSSGNFSSFNPSVYTGDQPWQGVVNTLFPNNADQRRSATYFDSLKNGNTWVKWNEFHFAKYIDSAASPITSQSLSGVNFPILRYADILLSYAEVLNELNGGPTADAYKAIGLVRARAYRLYTGGGNYSNHTYDLTAGLTQPQFRDSIFLERRKEFIQESNRWFDLVRRSGYDGLAPGQYYLDASSGAFCSQAA